MTGNARSWNISNNTKYISSIEKGEFPSEKEKLGVEDRINEAIMTGLRTIWGVSLDRIEKNYGEHYKLKILQQAQQHLDQETIKMENGHLFITTERTIFSRWDFCRFVYTEALGIYLG